MSLLIILGIAFVSCVYSIVDKSKPYAPAVKDWDAFNRDTVGMDKKEIENGLYQGRW